MFALTRHTWSFAAEHSKTCSCLLSPHWRPAVQQECNGRIAVRPLALHLCSQKKDLFFFHSPLDSSSNTHAVDLPLEPHFLWLKGSRKIWSFTQNKAQGQRSCPWACSARQTWHPKQREQRGKGVGMRDPWINMTISMPLPSCPPTLDPGHHPYRLLLFVTD